MWLINRGSCGTYVGVTRTTISTDRNVETYKNIKMGDFYNIDYLFYILKFIIKKRTI